MVTLPNILNGISDLLLRLTLLGHRYCAFPSLDPGKSVSVPGSLHLQILHLPGSTKDSGADATTQGSYSQQLASYDIR